MNHRRLGAIAECEESRLNRATEHGHAAINLFLRQVPDSVLVNFPDGWRQ
jgi:hypothetical protein